MALASPFTPMAQFPRLQSRHELYQHSKLLCLLVGAVSCKQHVNHCTLVQQYILLPPYFSIYRIPKGFNGLKRASLGGCLSACKGSQALRQTASSLPPFPLFTFSLHLPLWVSGGSSQPHNRQLCSLYLCVRLTFPPHEICLEDKHKPAEIL